MGQMIMENRNRYILGILLTVLSSLFFGMLGYFNTLAEIAGLQFGERLFYRFLTAALCILILLKMRGGNLRIPKSAFLKPGLFIANKSKGLENIAAPRAEEENFMNFLRFIYQYLFNFLISGFSIHS